MTTTHPRIAERVLQTIMEDRTVLDRLHRTLYVHPVDYADARAALAELSLPMIDVVPNRFVERGQVIVDHGHAIDDIAQARLESEGRAGLHTTPNSGDSPSRSRPGQGDYRPSRRTHGLGSSL